MKIRDRIWMTFRHLRMSLVGSILVILAIAIGVALAAATTAYIAAYNDQRDEILDNPVYREIYVEALGDPDSATELALPVVAATGDWKFANQFNLADLSMVLQSVGGLKYAYMADSTQFLSTSYLMQMGAGENPKGIEDRRPAAAITESEKKAETETAMVERRAAASEEAGDEAAAKREYFASKEADPKADPKAGSGKSYTDEEIAAMKSAYKDTAKDTSTGKVADTVAKEAKDAADWSTEPADVTELPIDEFSGIFATPDFFSAYDIEPVQGSLFTIEDMEKGSQVMVLGRDLAEMFFPKGNAVGSRIAVNTQTFTILGILEPTEIIDPQSNQSLDNIAIVPHFLFSGVTYGKMSRGKGLPTLRFAVEDSGSIQESVSALEEYLHQEYPTTNLRVSAAVDQFKADEEKLSRVLTALIFLTAAGLLIAAINMFNLLLIRILKQTKNIGVMRALGHTRNNILNHFLLETLMMSFAGAVIGLAASPFLYKFLRTTLISSNIGTEVYTPALLLGAGLAFLFSLIFGIYPAFTARQIDTATALRAE
jgi:putative ABC transport system permease protein